MASRKGSPNKLGAQAKENIAAVFVRLGSTAGMADWAADNKTEFYKLYARLLPQQVEADVRVSSEIDLTDEQLADIAAGGRSGAAETQACPPQPPTVQ